MPALLSCHAGRFLLQLLHANPSITMTNKRRSEQPALRVAFLHPDLGLGGERLA